MVGAVVCRSQTQFKLSTLATQWPCGLREVTALWSGSSSSLNRHMVTAASASQVPDKRHGPEAHLALPSPRLGLGPKLLPLSAPPRSPV